MYDPKIGQFLSEDFLGLMDDINPWRYVKNDPLDKIDPTGLFQVAAGSTDDAASLEKGVEKVIRGTKVNIKVATGDKTIAYGAKNVPIIGKVMVFEIKTESCDPKKLDIVQFIYRTADTKERITYTRPIRAPNLDEIGRRPILPTVTTAKFPSWSTDNVHNKTITATRGNTAARYEKDTLTFHDSPTFQVPDTAEAAILETFVVMNDKVVYRVHWEKHETVANVVSFPTEKRWGQKVDGFPAWAIRILHGDIAGRYIPESEGDLWKRDPSYGTAEFFKNFPSTYSPNP